MSDISYIASYARQNQANLDAVLYLLVSPDAPLESVRERWRSGSDGDKHALLQAALDAGWKSPVGA